MSKAKPTTGKAVTVHPLRQVLHEKLQASISAAQASGPADKNDPE